MSDDTLEKDVLDGKVDEVVAYAKDHPGEAADLLTREKEGQNRVTLVTQLQDLVVLADSGVAKSTDHLSADLPKQPTEFEKQQEAKFQQVAGRFGPFEAYQEVPTVRGVFGVPAGQVLVVPTDKGEAPYYEDQE